MRKTLFPLVALAVVGFLLIRRSLFASNVNVVLQDVALRGTITRPRINITLGILNPTNQKATIKSLIGSLSWNDRDFANVSSFRTTEVLANSETKLLIEAKPDLLGAASVIADLIKKGLKGGVVNFKGTINVNGVNIPLNVTKNV